MVEDSSTQLRLVEIKWRIHIFEGLMWAPDDNRRIYSDQLGSRYGEIPAMLIRHRQTIKYKPAVFVPRASIQKAFEYDKTTIVALSAIRSSFGRYCHYSTALISISGRMSAPPKVKI